MSDTSAFGFGKFVPGFDFLQNLGQAANPGAKGSPQGMPNMASWVAPTLSVEELDKRIQELKTVQFWLEQNTNALKATIQALEVQKMTLSTLQGMNVNMAELAKAFTAKMPDLQPEAKASEPQPAASKEEPAKEDSAPQDTAKGPAVDPMQWWGSLTQQFQNIAAAAVKDVAANAMKEGSQASKKMANTTANTMAKKSTKKATKSAKAQKPGAPGAQRTPRAPRAKKPAP
jgi:hypothetical protein